MNSPLRSKAKFSVRSLVAILLCTTIVVMSASCHAHKDCRGRRKVAKTQMGGWM